jgi:hypothetical protein
MTQGFQMVSWETLKRPKVSWETLQYDPWI